MENDKQGITQKFKEIFGVDIDPQYLEFVALNDGLDKNGYVIYSVNEEGDDNLFTANEEWNDPDYIFYGESDNELIAYNKSTGKYEIQDSLLGEVNKEYATFNDMLGEIIK